MSERTVDGPDERAIITHTRVPADLPEDESDEEPPIEDPDNAPIATTTRVPPRT